MREIILTFIGVALIAGSASPAAFAKERHRVHTARQYTYERDNDSRSGIVFAAKCRQIPHQDDVTGGGYGLFGAAS